MKKTFFHKQLLRKGGQLLLLSLSVTYASFFEASIRAADEIEPISSSGILPSP
jgi:hypothetical protein